jgi:hypothetical protein
MLPLYNCLRYLKTDVRGRVEGLVCRVTRAVVRASTAAIMKSRPLRYLRLSTGQMPTVTLNTGQRII